MTAFYDLPQVKIIYGFQSAMPCITSLTKRLELRQNHFSKDAILDQ
jgi:hypothetical protein